MKLSTLLKSINPIRVSTLGAENEAHCAGRREDDRQARCAVSLANLPDPELVSIHCRAQEVKPGGVFVAVEGLAADGHSFIEQALQRGAVVIVVQKDIKLLREHLSAAEVKKNNPVLVRVSDTRQALADLSARFYGRPSEHMILIGITGTNGKTTVAYLTERILSRSGFKVGVIGTINYRYAGKTFSNPMTTPESLDLQRILAEMRHHGITHVVMEASSHAMALSRIRSCWIDVAVFTNLSQDHLDFHGDMQSYWASKKRLFTEYLDQGPKKETAVAVINCDDEKGIELSQTLNRRMVKTGMTPDCDIKADLCEYNFNGTIGRVATPGGSFDFKTPLVGAHNVQNILSAAGVGVALKIAPDTIKAGIESVTAVPGRLEAVKNRTGRFVYVDYAHTPDALKNALAALREIAPARIICVFGCGGDRDKKKRPMMGAIAAQRCDLAIATSDNPRSEDPLAIIAQILPGIRQAHGVEYAPADIEAGFDKRGYVVEPDRRCAIEMGISASRPGDVVLIAGKGHETYQIIGTTRIMFDDREEALKALAKLDY